MQKEAQKNGIYKIDILSYNRIHTNACTKMRSIATTMKEEKKITDDCT